MLTLVTVPRYIALLKKYASQPTITKWLKTEGQPVELDEPLVLIETSKTSLELEAPATGLVCILKKEQEKVKIGDTIGAIAAGAEEFADLKNGHGG
jgi:pyruvate/2-oxoglutarate dehydrogenase complex dihydrolipoamide acyltransferase (E2) component